jgi:hypothetical protein
MQTLEPKDLKCVHTEWKHVLDQCYVTTIELNTEKKIFLYRRQFCPTHRFLFDFFLFLFDFCSKRA